MRNYFIQMSVSLGTIAAQAVACVKQNSGKVTRFAVVALLVFVGAPAFAQSGGVDFNDSASAIEQVASGMERYITPVQNVCYIIAALMGIIGGLSCALAMSNHEQDVTKKAAFTIGGVIFMVAIAQLIPIFFGMTGS